MYIPEKMRKRQPYSWEPLIRFITAVLKIHFIVDTSHPSYIPARHWFLSVNYHLGLLPVSLPSIQSQLLDATSVIMGHFLPNGPIAAQEVYAPQLACYSATLYTCISWTAWTSGWGRSGGRNQDIKADIIFVVDDGLGISTTSTDIHEGSGSPMLS